MKRLKRKGKAYSVTAHGFDRKADSIIQKRKDRARFLPFRGQEHAALPRFDLDDIRQTGIVNVISGEGRLPEGNEGFLSRHVLLDEAEQKDRSVEDNRSEPVFGEGIFPDPSLEDVAVVNHPLFRQSHIRLLPPWPGWYTP